MRGLLCARRRSEWGRGGGRADGGCLRHGRVRALRRSYMRRREDGRRGAPLLAWNATTAGGVARGGRGLQGSVICRLRAWESGKAGGVEGGGAAPLQTLKGALDCRCQFGQLTFDGAPDDLRVDVEVAVDESIAHADHRAPRNLRRPLTRVVRDVSCRFADELRARTVAREASCRYRDRDGHGRAGSRLRPALRPACAAGGSGHQAAYRV